MPVVLNHRQKWIAKQLQDEPLALAVLQKSCRTADLVEMERRGIIERDAGKVGLRDLAADGVKQNG